MNKYRKPPEYILDLHGYTCAETKTALNKLFCESSHRHIRIITGKGTFREKGAVLREQVKYLLRQKNIRFEQSKIKDGGEGALEVFL